MPARALSLAEIALEALSRPPKRLVRPFVRVEEGEEEVAVAVREVNRPPTLQDLFRRLDKRGNGELLNGLPGEGSGLLDDPLGLAVKAEVEPVVVLRL